MIKRVTPAWAPLVTHEDRYGDWGWPEPRWYVDTRDGWTAKRVVRWGELSGDLTMGLYYRVQENVN